MILLEGFLLWVAIAAVLVVVGFEVVWERTGLATVTLVAGLFGIWYLTGATDLLPWLRKNWDTILFLVVAHVVIGGVWSILNWRLFFLPDVFEKYQQDVVDWKWQYENWAGVKVGTVDVSEYIAKKEKEAGYPPLISQHKSDFFFWMWWWEFHATWTLAHKPIQRISRWFYDAVASMLNRMSSDYFEKRKANG